MNVEHNFGKLLAQQFNKVLAQVLIKKGYFLQQPF